MRSEEALRLFAGIAVMAGVALGYFVSQWFYLLVAATGFGLAQSAFTRWCPAMVMLEKFGIGDGSCSSK